MGKDNLRFFQIESRKIIGCDLICFESIVVDARTIDKITDHELGKMLNYLRITGLKLGLIVNFKNAKLEWNRVAL